MRFGAGRSAAGSGRDAFKQIKIAFFGEIWEIIMNHLPFLEKIVK